jgi:predicted TIM-barrel fold metal-dependent hydrolase
MIIDFHCHAGRGDLLTAPWNTDAPMKSYLRRARRAGIERTVVFPAFHTDYLTANRELARVVARWRPRLIGFAMVNAKSDAGRVREMVREAVAQLGFRGLKIHGGEAMPTREVCESAREFSLPVIVDVAGKAHVIDMFAQQFPEVRFIIAHLGSFADDWRAHERVIEQLVRYPNVWADTSGVRRFDYLVQAIKRAGPRKLLFGSDGPWLHPVVELHKIRLLGLSRAAEAEVLGINARRLLFTTNPSMNSRNFSLPEPERQLRRLPLPDSDVGIRDELLGRVLGVES